jgi:hypothetical protein
MAENRHEQSPENRPTFASIFAKGLINARKLSFRFSFLAMGALD